MLKGGHDIIILIHHGIKHIYRENEEDMNRRNVLQSAVIAAMYIVITLITSGIAFRDVQVRLSEALCVLPIFTPTAIPGLFVGCLLANFLAGAPTADIICGSLATLIGAFGTWKLRDRKPYIALLPPIIANQLVIPFVLKYGYKIEKPIWRMIITIGLGEICACLILGLLLYRLLLPRREEYFEN